MNKIKVKVLKDGKWAQLPHQPQLDVKVGDFVEIEPGHFESLRDAGKCEAVVEKAAKAKKSTPKSEGNPAKKDKKAAEG